MTSWWFGWDDLRWPDPVIEDKWLRRADAYREIGVNAVTTFGVHFRWDWLNYFERYHAMLRRVTEICHEWGIAVIDHHSNQLTHHIRSEADRQHITTYQDHHLPLFPDSWGNQVINGKHLADWRMISAKDGLPVYLNGYKAEAFCPNHPDYRDEYFRYLGKLVADTGVDGVMSDDTAFHPDIYACGCRFCRERFQRLTGEGIPAAERTDFWGRNDNLLFQAYIRMRYESVNDFYRDVRAALPSQTLLWGCCCTDPHPYKVRQGCSMEQWINHFDAAFAEIYHGLDLDKDYDRILSELAVMSSLGAYNRKPALILCYSDDPATLRHWSELCARFGALPWFCRQVRKIPVIYEDEILKEGYPHSAVTPMPDSCGVVYSRRLKDHLGEHDLSYYQAFIDTVGKCFANGQKPQIIFDDFKPEHCRYQTIYAPFYEQLDPEMKDYLNSTRLEIIR